MLNAREYVPRAALWLTLSQSYAPVPEVSVEMQDFNAMDPRAESAMRGMIAHADERFQALSTRVASMEDSLAAMTNATRELRAAIARGATIHVEGGAVDTAGIAEIRDHLSDLERHLADAFAHQAKRESEMVETLGARIHEETVRVSAETHLKVEALEATMKDAAGALSGLVQAAAEQVERLGQASDAAVPQGEGVPIGEVSLDSLQIDTGAMIDAFEERVVRLAALIRSDSTRIAEMIERGGQEQRTELTRALDSRLGRVSELVSATTMSAVAEVAREVPEAAKSALEEKVGELITSMDQNFVQLADVNETEIHRMGRYLSERTAELVDAAIAGRLSATLERITLAADAIEAAGVAGAEAGTGSGAGLGEAATADITVLIDDRITALAKMIRSDNTRLANVVEVAAQQEAAKQATRAVKELAASLPAQIIDLMDRRFAELAESLHRETQSTAVAVAKAADVVSDRIVEVEERYESGVERAADKLGDAVLNALASRRA